MSACAAGTAGAGIAFDLIKEGKADVMIAGGADPLTKFACTGFHSLKSLSPTCCTPFDKEHDGIIIGEGSAFFVIENLEHAKKRNAKIYGEILGYSINNEAYHITSPQPSGDGALISMKEALRKSNLSLDKLDYINAHGTATKANDNMELKAITNLLGDKVKDVAISSTKSMTGHCLGAAGSIELAIAMISLSKGFIPPTSTLRNPQEGFEDYNLVKEKGMKKELNYILSNSFAFAGNTSSIVIGKCNS
jgi:3-oxoacyl-[acyl-carrier-protein] synthase II